MTITPSMAKSLIEEFVGIEPVLSTKGPRKNQHIKYAYRFKYDGPITRHIAISTRSTEDGVTIYVNGRSASNILFPADELRPARVTQTYPKGYKGKTGDKGLSSAAAGLQTLDPEANDVLRLSVPSEEAFRRLLAWYFGTSVAGKVVATPDSVSPLELAEFIPTGENASSQGLDNDIDLATKEGHREEEIQLRAIKTRRGQPKFRESVLSAYECQCAITGCEVEDVLEAAHIVPHSEGTDWDVKNGFALRADIHTLFDLKLLTVAKDYRVHVSHRLAGSEYNKLSGLSIRMPKDTKCRPDRDKLAKHFAEFQRRNSDHQQ